MSRYFATDEGEFDGATAAAKPGTACSGCAGGAVCGHQAAPAPAERPSIARHDGAIDTEIDLTAGDLAG